MAWRMLPVPPVVTRPQGASPAATAASPWCRPRVMEMISASNFVALGHMSRCRTFTWAKRPKASFMKW